MKKSIVSYVSEIDEILKKKKIEKKDQLIEYHLQKIAFYQHERFIHLIVTCLFAILSLITFLYTIDHFSIPFFLLTVLFIALLIPYIFHYYTLENNVQKMYDQYDELKK